MSDSGRSEELIGEVLKEKEYDRSRIVIATKAAHVPNKGRTFDNSPEFLKQSVEDALKRLQTDYINVISLQTFQCVFHRLFEKLG